MVLGKTAEFEAYMKKMTSQSDIAPRIDTLAQKLTIRRALGQQRADKYFEHLKKWFSARITKADFDTILMKTIGLEHIPLHNRLIKSIAFNSCTQNAASPLATQKEEARVQPQTKAGEIISLESKPPQVETGSVEEGEEVEQTKVSPSIQSKGKLSLPPRGFCERVYKGVPKPICVNGGELPDTKTLMANLMEKLEGEGVKMTVESANLLNSAVDTYLKSVIRPCVALAGVKRRRLGGYRVSMGDLRSALEVNKKVLGEEWPLMMEKTMCRSFEQRGIL